MKAFLATLFRFLVVVLIILMPLSGGDSPIKWMTYLIWSALSLLSLLFVVSELRGKNFSILFCLLFVSLLITLSVNVVFSQTAGILETTVVLFSIPIIYAISIAFSTRERIIRFSQIMLFLCLIHSLVAFQQMVFGVDLVWGNPLAGGRPTGLFSWGAPVVGSFLGVAMSFYYLLPKEEIQRFKWTSIYLVSFLALVLSGNRSLLIIQVLFFMFHFLFYLSLRSKITVFAVTSLVVLFSLPYIKSSSQVLTQNQLYRLSSLGPRLIEEQKTKRIATWIQTYHMVKDRPIIGYGWGGYSRVSDDYLHYAIPSEGVMPHPHSFVLDVLYGFGVLFGGGGLIALWLSGIRTDYLSRDGKYFSLMVLIGFASPLNVTHGLASFWWLMLMVVVFGFANTKRGYV